MSTEDESIAEILQRGLYKIWIPRTARTPGDAETLDGGE